MGYHGPMLIVIRHGAPPKAYQGLWLGRRDVPLAPSSEAPLRALVPLLACFSPVALYTSPLTRARASAEIVGGALNLAPQITEDLTEMDLGAFEGLSPEEIRSRHPDAWVRYLEDNVNTAPPGGEPYRAMAGRLQAFVDQHLKDAALGRRIPVGGAVRDHPYGPTVLLFTHTGPLLALTARALGLSLERRIRLAPPYASATGLILNPPELHFFGQTGVGGPNS